MKYPLRSSSEDRNKGTASSSSIQVKPSENSNKPAASSSSSRVESGTPSIQLRRSSRRRARKEHYKGSPLQSDSSPKAPHQKSSPKARQKDDDLEELKRQTKKVSINESSNTVHTFSSSSTPAANNNEADNIKAVDEANSSTEEAFCSSSTRASNNEADDKAVEEADSTKEATPAANIEADNKAVNEADSTKEAFCSSSSPASNNEADDKAVEEATPAANIEADNKAVDEAGSTEEAAPAANIEADNIKDVDEADSTEEAAPAANIEADNKAVDEADSTEEAAPAANNEADNKNKAVDEADSTEEASTLEDTVEATKEASTLDNGSASATINAHSMKCPGCSSVFDMFHGFTMLAPCHHILCCCCAIHRLATRPADEKMKCAQCPSPVDASCYAILTGIEDGRKTFKNSERIIHTEPIRNVYHDPDPTKDPWRYFMRENQENCARGYIQGAIGVANQDGNDAQSLTFKSNFDLNESGFASYDDQAQLSKLAIGALHPILFGKKARKEDVGDLLSAERFIEKAFEDKSPGFNLLYALSRGRLLDNDERQMVKADQKSSDRSNFLAVYCAYQLLLYINSPKPSGLALLVGDFVYNITRSKQLQDLLSEFRMAASYNTIERIEWAQLQECMDQQTMEIEDFSFLFQSLDNLGFMKAGLKAGRVEYTILTQYIVPRNELCEVGFYSDDPNRQICRQGGSTLEELVIRLEEEGKDPFEEIVFPNGFNANIYGFYNLCHMECALKLKLPNLQACREMLRAKAFDPTGYDGIPLNLGIDVSPQIAKLDDSRKNRIPVFPRKYERQGYRVREARAGGEPSDADYLSLLSATNAKLDYPFQVDLAKKATVQMLLTYSTEIQRKKAKKELVQINPGDERPVQEIMIPFAVDGSPGCQALEFIDQDVDSTPEGQLPAFRDSRVFSGGFHALMKTIEVKSSLAEECVLFWISTYRPTEGKQKFVMFPRDPTQAIEEMLPYAMAMRRAAGDELAEYLGITEVSAAQVDEHMMSRAQQYPVCMQTLLDTRLTEVFFILRDSETTGSADLFMTAIRHMIPAFAANHNYKYVRIGIELCVWWATAPLAEQVIFENFVLTRKIASGKRLFTDRVQEMFNKLVRAECGDNMTQGNDVRMVRACLMQGEINDKKKMSQRLKTSRTTHRWDSKNERNVKTSLFEIYVRVYTKVRQMQIWHGALHPLLFVKRGAVKKASATVLESLKGAKFLNSRHLFAWSTGGLRAKQYFNEFYIKSRHRVKRSQTGEHGVDLTSLNTTQQKMEGLVDGKVKMGTSTDILQIISASKKRRAPLVKEIRKIAESEDADLEDEVRQHCLSDDLLKDTVNELAMCLCSLRINHFKKNPQLPAEITERIRDDCRVVAESTLDQRITELGTILYKLPEEIVGQFATKITLRH
jgi:hypothetical protein